MPDVDEMIELPEWTDGAIRPGTGGTKRYKHRTRGYPTDHLIDSLSDEELLLHMQVPAVFVGHAIGMKDDLPDEVEYWLEHLPYIYRPAIENLSKGMCGSNLILTGPSGARKTTMAAAILLRTIRQKVPNTDPTGKNFTWHGAAMGLFVDWQEASEIIRSASSGDEAGEEAHRIKDLMYPAGQPTVRGDFLIIDDISRERATEFNTGELHRIIRRRSDRGYPSIITTNHHQEDWDKNHGEILASYLSRTSIVVECHKP